MDIQLAHSDITHKTIVLSGGVGAARFLAGLQQIVDPTSICAIINTGDDIEFHGLAISPDVDIVMCTLAGIIHPTQGWGIVDDSDHCMTMLRTLGAPDWFMLGDKDLALHIQRTALRKKGWNETQITQQFRTALGVKATLLPMTHDSVQTHIITPAGDVHFQEYLVRDRAKAQILGIEYRGITSAHATGDVLHSLRTAAGIIIAPSNPLVSVGTILGLPHVRQLISQRHVPAIAISPIVGGAAIKGPAVAMLNYAGIAVSALGVAQHYQGLIDGMVIDNVDATLAPAIEALGMAVCVTDTIMSDDMRKANLARTCMEFMATLP
ncbi:MAG: 2-phospho-L-lactate transferase [Chloroflexia bacterium]|nr:2-phospho-L-lactate transferase [Chloroflexia bacterium]